MYKFKWRLLIRHLVEYFSIWLNGAVVDKIWEMASVVFSKAKREDEISSGNKCPLLRLHNVFHTLHASASTIYVTATVLGFSFWLLRFILNEKDESYYLSSFVFTGLHCVKIYGTLEVYKNWTLCVEACLL